MGDIERARRELSHAQLEQIFQHTIKDELVHPGLPLRMDNADAELVLVVGQAGAGTGDLHAQVAGEFQERGGIVGVVTDRMRTYHPDYQWLRQSRPAALVQCTDQAARWWQTRAVDYLTMQGYNILCEDRYSTPDRVLDTAAAHSRVGYDVRISVPATSAVLSRLGVIEAYAVGAAVLGAGPSVSAEDHDASYAQVVEILERAEGTDATCVGRITLHTTLGVLYERQRDALGHWPRGTPSAVEVLGDARNEPLTRAQRTALADRLAATIERLAGAGNAPRSVYDMAGQICQDLAGYPLALDGRITSRLNIAMIGLLDSDPEATPHDLDALDEARVDIDIANCYLDHPTHAPPPSPDLDPPTPDLGPEP